MNTLHVPFFIFFFYLCTLSPLCREVRRGFQFTNYLPWKKISGKVCCFILMLNLYGRRFIIFKLLYIQALCLPLQNNSRIIYDQRQTGKYNIQISIKDVAIIEVDKNEFIDDTINDADDYYYDDDDLTIRPISSWMASSTTTVKTVPLSNTLTEEPIDSQNVTNKQEVNVLKSHPHTSTTNIGVVNSSLNLNLHSSLSPSFTYSPNESDIALRLVMEPVVHEQKTMKDIPQIHSAQRRRQDTGSVTHFFPNKFRREKEIDSTILKIITAQPLSIKKLAICKSNYVVDGNGNCRRKRRSSFFKNFFDVLKLMRIRER